VSSGQKRPQQPELSRAFVCPRCELPALAIVRGIAVWDGWDKEHVLPVGLPTEYVLVQCGECREVSVQIREDFGRGFQDDKPGIVYPARRKLSRDVPEPLRREFEEAQTCFSAKAYEATVVMVRRILEGTCKENNVQERTFVKSLAKLKVDGLIDDTIAEWADALRVLGNEGAHYTGRQVPRDDSEDSLAFAEALLDHIYVLRKRFEEFAQRRANKRVSTAPPPENPNLQPSDP
jgi:Domain of unknown function (DUF4145)